LGKEVEPPRREEGKRKEELNRRDTESAEIHRGVFKIFERQVTNYHSPSPVNEGREILGS